MSEGCKQFQQCYVPFTCEVEVETTTKLCFLAFQPYLTVLKAPFFCSLAFALAFNHRFFCYLLTVRRICHKQKNDDLSTEQFTVSTTVNC